MRKGARQRRSQTIVSTLSTFRAAHHVQTSFAYASRGTASRSSSFATQTTLRPGARREGSLAGLPHSL
eukprot:scaffold99657_cov27-Phaeocystis_antarctica.AAC.1